MSELKFVEAGKTLELIDGLYIKGQIFGGIAICVEGATHKLNLTTEHMTVLRDFLNVQLEGSKMRTIHISGRCDFCGQCTDWPDDYCVSCKEEGFDKEDKKGT